MAGKVIIVEGIIGAGKSLLAPELGKALGDGTLVLMEPDERGGLNPYLADFYKDTDRWALTMQMHLLSRRYRMHLQAQWHSMNTGGHAVMDRSFYGDTCFARMMNRSGHISDREFETYSLTYHAMTASVLLPQVCVRLLVSPEIAAERIGKRLSEREGRKSEGSIDLGYLKKLDMEITHMTNVLSSQGVKVLELPWDVDRDSSEDRERAVTSLASRIKEFSPPDVFLDLHRRTI